MTYNINRPESVSTVNPLLARDEEEDLISQELKKGMLADPIFVVKFNRKATFTRQALHVQQLP